MNKAKEKYIYDPIHGYIKINPWELDIINNKIFQRLRWIRQLGPAEYIFPTATHTRFSHSIGVMHLATIFLDNINKNNPKLFDDHEDFEEIKRKVRIAALLHDIGHLPFSHAFEIKDISHENIGTERIFNFFLEELDKSGFKVEEISGAFKDPTLGLILKSPFDVDKLDYLLRDSYFTGVSYGYLDIKRLLHLLYPDIMEEGEGYVWVIKEKGLPAIEDMIIGRFHMFQTVYYHKTLSAFEALYQKIVEKFVETGIIELEKIVSNENFWFRFNDSFILERITEGATTRQVYSITRNEHIKIDDNLQKACKHFIHRKPPKLVMEGRRYRNGQRDEEYSVLNTYELGIKSSYPVKIEGINEEQIFWSLIYAPSLRMIKDQPETKGDILYVQKRNGAKVQLRNTLSIINNLRDQEYEIKRLFTKIARRKPPNLFGG